jgi:hypothetical protein
MNVEEISLGKAIKSLRAALSTESSDVNNAVSDALLGHWLMDGSSSSSFLPAAAASIWPQVKRKRFFDC